MQRAWNQLLKTPNKAYYDGRSLWRLVDAVEVSGIYSYDGELVLQEFRGFNGWKSHFSRKPKPTAEVAVNRWGKPINPYQHWGFRIEAYKVQEAANV